MFANRRRNSIRAWAMGGAAALAIAHVASAEEVNYDIDGQDLGAALNEFGLQSRMEILFSPTLTRAKMTSGVAGEYEPTAALDVLLDGTGLRYRVADLDTILIEDENAVTEVPQSDILLAQAETGGSSTGRTREKIIVTGQKREEYIQDVPIAISAFSQEDLTMSQIAGGPDLITQIPNFTFTKTNFTGYSIQIRGIGTQAISATTDAAVAVAMNNTPFIRNRFFEQEFYDMERVEVLRGPQGTLYGRNATAGVVNLITAKPILGEDEARASLDLGNFESQRMEAMVNVPLVDDQVALRLAGAWTKRDGYATNEITGRPIDGRDLWSTRASLRFAPTDRLDVNLLWEHFEEEDDRLRSGKQLCKKHVVTEVNGVEVEEFDQTLRNNNIAQPWIAVQPRFSQGCIRTSLYDTGNPDELDAFGTPDFGAFGTPNGAMVPYNVPLKAIGGLPAFFDPYASQSQSTDLRVIESTVDPIYEAAADIGALQVRFNLTENLTLESETAYQTDFVYSLQDFNRFNTVENAFCIYGTLPTGGCREEPLSGGDYPITRNTLNEDGVWCDPQLGCTSRLVAVDLSTARSKQFSQELRLSSQFGGPFNFSLGANFLRFDTEDKYYVFINHLTLAAADDEASLAFPYEPGVTMNTDCMPNGQLTGELDDNGGLADGGGGVAGGYNCIYIEQNSIANIQDQGHNYFLSKNPYKLISYAAFGEAYWNLTDNLKLTGGLRWTVDQKTAPRIPSWTTVGTSRGYPVLEVIEQEWQEPTGRLALDWKPDLAFTEDTLVYGSYARGYKAGGANPPPFVNPLTPRSYGAEQFVEFDSVTRPKTFDAEFVNAFELGSKNTFMDGDVTLNVAAFYYDYEGYQISEIVDRSAFNRNFDAEVWGAEFEAEWWALENLRLSLKGGYQKTRIADGEEAVDLMDRTAGNEDWVVVRPFPTSPSSCILPVWLFANEGTEIWDVGDGGGAASGGCERAYLLGNDPITNDPYEPFPTFVLGGPFPVSLFPDGYPGWNPETAPNNGEGFAKDLGGNELPNAPNWTGTLSADYILPLGTDWTLTFHGDFHYQSESWWRVFNDHEFNRLNEYYTMNLAAILKSEDGWNIMGYIKNVTDETAITGAFLNSDDTGLTTNVFLTEPRLYGVRITKDWTGGTFLGSLIDGERRDPDKPYLLNVTLGAQIQRHDAPNTPLAPSFIDEFSDTINPFEDQTKDLDWGDGRDVKVVYQPGDVWRFGLDVRFGKTNRSDPWVERREFADKACVSDYDDCLPGEYVGYFFERDNFTISTSYDREDHTIVEFTVGRDLGVGGLERSTLAAGLRYAEFNSESSAHIFGQTNWDIPVDENTFTDKYNDVTWDGYSARLAAEREFSGLGPILNWEASMALLGDHDTGVLGLDWALTGGVLFGKRKTEGGGADVPDGEYAEVAYDYVMSVSSFTNFSGGGDHRWRPDATTPLPPVAFARANDVSVPTLGAALGMSYRVDRFRIGAGYRWERYYEVIDGGYTEEGAEDRTIDGPYLNVTVGFGG